MFRKLVAAQVNTLGDDEVEVILSTAALARDGHILIPQGCLLDNYRANNIVLWQHDPEHPVGNAENIVVSNDNITARIRFAPLGATRKADETRALVKSGVVRAVSIGFEPMDGEPLDPKKPRGGQRVTKWELLECSFVSVPADTGAVVTARAHGGNDMSDWKVGASRDLPVEDSDGWDGDEAAASIFDDAGGDDFDPAKARKGFLVYDASAPKKRESYKLPIARAKDGKLTVPKAAIRAAASRLPDTDIPDDVKKRAQGVLDHYKEKAGMNDGDRARKQAYTRVFGKRAKKRDLCDVSALAWSILCLGQDAHCAKIEAAIEGDGSAVPAQFAAAVKELCDVLVAMAEEETEELVEFLSGSDDDGDELETHSLTDDERAFITSAKSGRSRRFRQRLIRAGKVLSKSNADRLEESADHHERGMKYHRAATEHHADAGKQIEAMGSQHDTAQDAHEAVGKALASANTNDAKAAHEKLGKSLAKMKRARSVLKDAHDDTADAHDGIGRCMRAANECIRAVLDGAVKGSEDGDSTDIQDSASTGEDEGARSADYRRRQAERLKLKLVA